MMSGVRGERLRVTGKVQGVGFRPWIWQLARQLALCGDVCNDGAGVEIRLLGNADPLLARLHGQCPPLARIDAIQRVPMRWQAAPAAFSIRESGGGAMHTHIVPDAATCPACLAELNDPADRRYHYPFVNCTHCGPRLTIIRAMPYDRPFTSMASFPLCPACAAEYQNPADRRFHAQPVACPSCGPFLIWQRPPDQAYQHAALAAAVDAIQAGGIVAIKGTGGFHLACDATCQRAIATLRQRKRRPHKPLAVMVPPAIPLPAPLRELLLSPAAPIVLVDKALVPLEQAELIAPDLAEIGVMFPANPLQHLLIQALQRPLIMTSGNASGEAPALSNEQALVDLAAIADGWLCHNRDIVQRMDDSLVRWHNTRPATVEMLRRARGYVPDPLALPPGFQPAPPILACGADLKNTFCLLRDDQAVVSQHFGDLARPGIGEQWQQALEYWQALYQFVPRHIALDAHPGWQSSQWGRAQAAQERLAVWEVLHHHAHAAACLAEHGYPLDAPPVLALTLDGLGYGGDQQWWGGECLLVDYLHCQRLGGLPAVALPGGDLAARQPWRNLLAHCLAFVPDWQRYPDTAQLQAQSWQPLARAIARGIHSPRASSCGRLFDAVAAALGFAPDAPLSVSNPAFIPHPLPVQSYEGQAACWLEALARQCDGLSHPLRLELVNGQLDLACFWQSWLNWRAGKVERAWAFHDALAAGFAALARFHAHPRGITTIAACGGVLHNRLFRQRLAYWLEEFSLWFPERLPAGDGAISYGQAVIAAAHVQKGAEYVDKNPT